MSRPDWEFEYLAISSDYRAPEVDVDFVVATWSETAPSDLERAFRAFGGGADVEVVLVKPPLFWYRLRVGTPREPESVLSALRTAGIRARYVTSSSSGSLARGPRPDFTRAAGGGAPSWTVRSARGHREERSAGRWFLGSNAGVDVDRSVCGTGAGTRLAVIDDEARDAHSLDLEAEVLVGIPAPPRGSQHGSLMVAWAVGTRGDPERGVSPFAGVAPDASPRLYLTEKPGHELIGLPLAIAQAVDDGADVIVCAAYVEGRTSPLLDDALDFAARLGRGGLGTAVILPAGREISSPPGSLHASLTLGLGEPASDPRVLCVAPSGRHGGWFLWTDKHGKKKPFSNRGPAVRVAAPGDDMANPLAGDDRLGHAESSGASAIAAGVALLVLGGNPSLTARELYDVLASTARPCDGPTPGPLADPADVLPLGRDLDGHDAKCGYGRLSAFRACLVATDPVSAGLVAMGEEDAARRYAVLRSTRGPLAFAYSRALGNSAAQALREDAALSHALRCLLRHLRLIAGRSACHESEARGATARALSVVIDQIAPREASAEVCDELRVLRQRAIEATQSPEAAEALDRRCAMLAAELWKPSTTERGSTCEGKTRLASAVGGIGRSA